MKSLSNIFFVCCKFFMCKMQEGDNFGDHVNKVKMFVDQLAYLEIVMREEDIVMTLFESLLASYNNLITALKSIPIKDLTMIA